MSRCLAVLIALALAAVSACSKPIRPTEAKTSYDHFERGKRHAERGQYADAVACYDQAMELRPDFAPLHWHRGIAHEELGNYREALADYRRCVELSPGWGDGHNRLAWLLATCPEAPLRDGTMAAEHATRACELARWNGADCMETLAAASAEAGRFAVAVKWQKQALEQAEGAPEEQLSEMRERLKLYEAGKPYRQQRSRPGPTDQRSHP